MQDKEERGWIQARIRAASKTLLGAQFRGEVAALIGAGEAPFWARRVSEQLGIPENKISAELVRLADSNLLAVLDADPWDRRKLYQRLPSALWDFAIQLVEDAVRVVASEHGRDPEQLYRDYWSEVITDGPLPTLRTHRHAVDGGSGAPV